MVLTQHRHTLLILLCVGWSKDVMSRLEKKSQRFSCTGELLGNVSSLSAHRHCTLSNTFWVYLWMLLWRWLRNGRQNELPKNVEKRKFFLLLEKKWIKCKLSKILFSFFLFLCVFGSSAAVVLSNSLIFFYFYFFHRVRNWALKFGVDIWEFGRQFTKMNEIKNVSCTFLHSTQHPLSSLPVSCRFLARCSQCGYA